MTSPERWAISQSSIQAGRGQGARFMKKPSLAAPSGYRRMTMARSRMWGSSTGAMSA